MKDNGINTKEILLSLYERLVNGAELKAIVRKAQSYLSNPVIIADKSCGIVCCAGLPQESENRVWRSILDEGCYPAEYLESFSRENGLGRVYTENSPLTVRDEYSGCSSVFFKVAFGGINSGFAELPELKRPATEADIEIFTALCRIAGTAMQGKKRAEDEKQSYEYVISEILNGSLYGDRMKEQLNAVNIEANAGRCVFVIEKTNGGKMFTEFVKRSAEAIVRGCRCIAYNGKVVMLVGSRSGGLLSAEERAGFKKFLIDNELVCGGSCRFETMNDLPSAYNQATTASRIGRRMESGGPIYFLWENSTYQMCDMLYGKCNLLDFCNPMIVMILHYDAKNNTSFLDTLKEYINSGCSPVKAAKSLGVHRNTVDYRLSRLRELFDLNVDDHEMMFSFKQSFQIIYYLEKNGREADLVSIT